MNIKPITLVIGGIILVLVGILIGWQLGSGGEEEIAEEKIEVLKMGLIPADDAEEMLREYETVRLYLEEALGIPRSSESTGLIGPVR